VSPGGAADSPAVSPRRIGAGDLKQTAEAAMRAVPGATVMAMETEEDGRRWEVTLVSKDGTEHEVNVEAGKVVSGPVAEGQDSDNRAEQRKLMAAAKLTYAQAADKVMADVPEGRITELALDYEQGKTVWESDVVTPNGVKHEVAVDAATGDVIRANGATT
jgi:uncharacterized membrane protein YkoI